MVGKIQPYRLISCPVQFWSVFENSSSDHHKVAKKEIDILCIYLCICILKHGKNNYLLPERAVAPVGTGWRALALPVFGKSK